MVRLPKFRCAYTHVGVGIYSITEPVSKPDPKNSNKNPNRCRKIPERILN